MTDIDTLAQRDADARAQALDVRRSWLVQAPAGSGKTELLIGRFLALLAIVDRPASIVAMTFTRKAAAEMRERVVAALRDADTEAVAGPQLPAHAQLTRRLARAALARDRQQRWQLLEQPSRLRIITIDAMATALARQAPVTSGLGALPRFVDDADILYVEAARAALEAAGGDDANWRTFVTWLDNDAGAATRLLAQMLAARDRWPARIFSDDPATLRADVERVLDLEIRAALRGVRDRMPAHLATALPAHARHALEHFESTGTGPPFIDALRALARNAALPDVDALDAWRALADWLLTGGGTFIRAINVNHGFPPAGGRATDRQQRKADFARWLFDAAAVPGLAEAWHRLRSLPPARYGDDGWAFVVAAMRVLPRAADALSGIFAARGQADFTEATLRALNALGTADDPSDLLLAVDYRLSHLLIDEFQDTSRAQLALIGRLCEGWQPGDGRTLFAVGDPMQSIYRFRQAEVRLFIEAQQRRRVGNVDVGVVELARNFRSQHRIVDWVNAVFGHVLPRESDAARGEAGYRIAYADASTGADVEPTLDLVATRCAEADVVVRRVRDALADGMASVAVLVRARSHAQALLPALRAAGIEFAAVDLEGLHDRLATRDLLSLARALAQPADRLAWLAILRAPWCGLPLEDLLAIANASVDRPLADVLFDGDSAIAVVSADSRRRLARFKAAVAPALAARGRTGFALRVRAAWLALGGPACTPTALDRDGADRLFALLAEHERGGDLHDYDRLLAMAERLFAQAGESASARVQLMTLHRAKGLQFDAVILPALDVETAGPGQPLLRWRSREHDGEPTLVLAPMRARVGLRAENDPVYRWLGTLDAAEEVAELGRLLYVGATRARRRLHLTAVATCASTPRAWKRPARGSPLERLWDAVAHALPTPSDDPATDATAEAAQESGLLRLPVDWQPPPLPPVLVAPVPTIVRSDLPVFDWADAVAAAIGTVAHRVLAQIAAEGVAAWDERRLQRERERIMAELGTEGIEPGLRERAAQRVAAVVAATLGDPRGRWLFDPAHEDARSEWALAGVDGDAIVHVVIDRSFVAAGVRYVVDFKTGAHLGGNAAAFLDQELARYRPQLERYARIVRGIDARPIRIALYHPLVAGGWQEHAAG
jgi:ATP-dependent exoDNAse (exonuclease V) beta subunit